MRQASQEFVIDTQGPGLVPFTSEVLAWVQGSGIATGLLTLHVMHTSASLLIQENADPEVLADFERFFRRLVPEGDPLFRHVSGRAAPRLETSSRPPPNCCRGSTR